LIQTARIEDVTEFVLDGTHGSPERTESGIPVLSAQNVKNGCLNFETERFTSENEYKSFQSRLSLSKGDVLLTIVGTVGRSAVVEDVQPLVFQRSVAVLRPKRDLLDSRFLFHVIQTREFQAQLTKSTNKSSQAGVYLGKLKELFVPLPSLTEQKRIADILDRAEALRAKRRVAIAQLDELVQSVFIEMFGDPANNSKKWPICNIGDLLESASYGTSEKAGATGEYPVLRMNNITRTGEMDLTDLKFMDLADSQKERYLVRAGDVLFNRTNSAELVGKTAVFRNDKPMAYAGYLIRLRVNNQNDPEYLSAFLNTSYSKRMLRGMCKSIIGMANINATEIQAMKIPQPPLELQNEFSCRVATVEKTKATHRASLAELDELFASLQYRAFRGEL
jgi:type I restriction enzyme S subunit